MTARLHAMRLLPLLAIPLVLGTLVAPVSSSGEQPSQPFAEAELFFEHNCRNWSATSSISLDEV